MSRRVDRRSYRSDEWRRVFDQHEMRDAQRMVAEVNDGPPYVSDHFFASAEDAASTLGLIQTDRLRAERLIHQIAEQEREAYDVAREVARGNWPAVVQKAIVERGIQLRSRRSFSKGKALPEGSKRKHGGKPVVKRGGKWVPDTQPGAAAAEEGPKGRSKAAKPGKNQGDVGERFRQMRQKAKEHGYRVTGKLHDKLGHDHLDRLEAGLAQQAKKDGKDWHAKKDDGAGSPQAGDKPVAKPTAKEPKARAKPAKEKAADPKSKKIVTGRGTTTADRKRNRHEAKAAQARKDGNTRLAAKHDKQAAALGPDPRVGQGVRFKGEDGELQTGKVVDAKTGHLVVEHEGQKHEVPHGDYSLHTKPPRALQAHKGDRTIGIDEQEIRYYVQKHIDASYKPPTAKRQGRNTAALSIIGTAHITRPDGVEMHVPIYVNPKPQHQTSGIFETHGRLDDKGKLVPVKYRIQLHPPKTSAWSAEEMAADVRRVLAHELAHALDPGAAKQRKRDLADKTTAITSDAEMKAANDVYYNRPTEVVAFRHNIFRELNDPKVAKAIQEERQDLLAEDYDPDNPAWKPQNLDHVVTGALAWHSDTWTRVKDHLAPENRRKIMEMAAHVVMGHLDGTSKPMAKSRVPEVEGFDLAVDWLTGDIFVKAATYTTKQEAVAAIRALHIAGNFRTEPFQLFANQLQTGARTPADLANSMRRAAAKHPDRDEAVQVAHAIRGFKPSVAAEVAAGASKPGLAPKRGGKSGGHRRQHLSSSVNAKGSKHEEPKAAPKPAVPVKAPKPAVKVKPPKPGVPGKVRAKVSPALQTKSEQIKATENEGTFDPKTPGIYKAGVDPFLEAIEAPALRSMHGVNDYGHRDNLEPGMVLKARKRHGSKSIEVLNEGRFWHDGEVFTGTQALLKALYGNGDHHMTARRYFKLGGERSTKAG